jgi:hypothetical protein
MFSRADPLLGQSCHQSSFAAGSVQVHLTRMQSKATTVAAYMASLPADRREAIDAVRNVFKTNLDPKIQEGMSYGMIGYSIPHSYYPAGYHCNPSMPLPYAGLASQKGYMSVYLMPCYLGSDLLKWFETAWAKTGKKLNMGKCCIRFKKVEDLALDVIGETLRRLSADAYIKTYESLLKGSAAASKERKAAKVAAKNTASSPAPSKAKPAAKAPTKATTKVAQKASRKSASKTAAKPTSKPTSKTKRRK